MSGSRRGLPGSLLSCGGGGRAGVGEAQIPPVPRPRPSGLLLGVKVSGSRRGHVGVTPGSRRGHIGVTSGSAWVTDTTCTARSSY